MDGDNPNSMLSSLLTGLAVFAALAGWAGAAGAGLFSATGPVIAIIAGDLFVGEAEGHLNGSGTFQIQSRTRPAITCRGQFTHSAEFGNAGSMQCSDGAAGTFQFQRLSILRGHGTGSVSRSSMSFTYGLSSIESEPYLKLPRGKALRLDGKDLLLVDARRSTPANVPAAAPASGNTRSQLF
jgi:hypothetical protein